LKNNLQSEFIPVADKVPVADKAIDLLHQMVQIPSVSGEEKSLSQLLVREAKSLGYDEAFIDGAGNFIASMGQGETEIVLLGHMDTVPGGPAVQIENNILYGRGSVDAKGSLSTFIMAGHQLMQREQWKSSLKNKYKLIIIGAVEEEADSKGALFIKDNSGYHPQFCIIGEPSQWDSVVLGYKGCFRLRYHHAIDTAHTAAPMPGVAEYAFDYWAAIKNYVDTFNRGKTSVFQQLQVKLTAINTFVENQQDNVVAKFIFRLPPALTLIDVEQQLRKLVEPIGGTFECYGKEQAYMSSRATPLTPAFANAIQQQGGQIKFKYKTGTSDMNIVGPVWKCPMVAYGPGDSALDHTPDEHISLDEYLKAIAVLGSSLEFVMNK
jgi:[amino group carrier protein]-lysine/ornithine hydrolase